jgi:hypothetical protein
MKRGRLWVTSPAGDGFKSHPPHLNTQICRGQLDTTRRSDYGGSYSGMLISSAEKMMNIMRSLAKKGDLDGICKYYINALGDLTGKRVGKILSQYGKKSLESEFLKVNKIYNEQ